MSNSWQVFARRALKCERGSAASEFVLVLPLLLMLTVAFYEAGRLFWSYNIVAASSRDAARYAARLVLTCPDTLSATDITKIQRLARTGTVAAGGSPLVPGWTSDSSVNVQVSCVANPTGGVTYQGRYDGMANIPTVTVTSAAPFNLIFGQFFPAINLTSISTTNRQVWTE